MVFNRFFKLDQGVEKTRQGFFGKLTSLFTRETIDDEIWDELEEALLGADVGVQMTDSLLGDLQERTQRGELKSTAQLQTALRTSLAQVLEDAAKETQLLVDGLNVVLIIGVNGVGKT